MRSYDFMGEIAKAQEASTRRMQSEADALGISLDEYERRITTEKQAGEAEAAMLVRRSIVRRKVGEDTCDHLPAAIVEALISRTTRETEASREVRDYMESSTKPFLVLSGGTGSGKTCAAVWGMTLSKSDSNVYVPSSALARRYEPWGGDKAAGIEPLDTGAYMLVLDDLGTERLEDPRFADAIGAAIDGRIGPIVNWKGSEIEHRKTIITTNLSAADIKARYGARIASRFAEHAKFVALGGDDMRRARR